MSLSHGEEGPRARVVEYESHVLGLAAIVVSVVYGGQNAKSSLRSVLYEGRSRMSVS